MKLMVVNRDSAVGGGITYVRHLSKALVQQGWEVSYAAPPGRMRPMIRQSGARIHSKAFFSVLQLPLIVRFLKRTKPDVVDSQARGTSVIIGAACRLAKIPWTATMHGPIQDHKFAGPTEKALLSADAVVTLDVAVGAHYNKLGVPAERIFSSHLFVPWRESAPCKDREIRLCYCSRLSSKKGKRGLAFVQAAANLGYPVTVVGTGKYGKEIEEAGGNMVGMTLTPSTHFEKATIIGGAGFVAIEAIESGCIPIGMGFAGCLGAVSADRITWAADRNYGDHAGTRGFDASVPAMEREIKCAVETLMAGGAQDLRLAAEQIHSLEKNAKSVDRFFRSVATRQCIAGLGDDVTQFVA